MADELSPRFVERERRFLARTDAPIYGTTWELITQAYVYAEDGYAIRVRTSSEVGNDHELSVRSSFLTAKGPREGTSREEYQVEIPGDFATSIIARSKLVVIKKRHSVIDAGLTWEIDEFQGKNYGLTIAEIEISGPELSSIKIPHWAGTEIINDPRFDNESLAAFPYSKWG